MRHHLRVSMLPAVVRGRVARFLTLADATRWLVYALEYNDEELAQLLWYGGPYAMATRRASVLHAAAAAGCLHAMATLLGANDTAGGGQNKLLSAMTLRLRRPLPPWVLYAVIPSSDDRFVQWLHARTRHDPIAAATIAAHHKRLPLAQWLLARQGSRLARPPTQRRVQVQCAFNGEYMAWLVMAVDNEEGELVQSHFASTAHGLAPVVCYRLYDVMSPVLYPAMDYAARVGDLRLLQRLHDDGDVRWPCTTRAMDVAATRGDMEMLQWLHMNRAEGCTHKAMDGAARGGHFEVVKWLYYVRQVTGTATAFDDAAAADRLRVLKWQATRFLHFKVSTEALEQAAGSGHLEVLKWVEETRTRVQLTPAMVQSAVNEGQFDVLKWLLSKAEDPRPFLQSHFLSRGASSGNVEMMQWLWREYRLLSADALHHALVSGSRPMVDWLIHVVEGEDRRLRVHTLYEMARRGHWTLLEWLLRTHGDLCNFCELFPRGRLRNARLRTDGSPRVSFLERYVSLMIRYFPAACLSEPRLPEWAAHHAQVDVLHTLQYLHHPQATEAKLVHILMTTMASAKASDIVKTIVTEHPECIGRPVVQWEAAYSHAGLLGHILKMAELEAVAVIRIALFTACRHGQMQVLNWVSHHASLVGCNVNVWSGAARVAAKHDQVEVMQWLQTSESKRSEHL